MIYGPLCDYMACYVEETLKHLLVLLISLHGYDGSLAHGNLEPTHKSWREHLVIKIKNPIDLGCGLHLEHTHMSIFFLQIYMMTMLTWMELLA